MGTILDLTSIIAMRNSSFYVLLESDFTASKSPVADAAGLFMINDARTMTS